jgi:hypothetical protein
VRPVVLLAAVHFASFRLMIRTLLAALLFAIAPIVAHAQKSVFIPEQFSRAPWNEWSWAKSYQSDNFFIVWGNRAGATPATHSDPNLRFDPAQLASYLEASYRTFVTEVRFVSDSATTLLGRYKIIVVMNETYEGPNGPTGWAFGAAYDDTIGALWVHPNATRDPYVLSHELVHALQAQNAIEGNTFGGGFVGFEPAGWFWEAHANYMRCVEFPHFAADDMPRWLATRSYHLGSTRHHYAAFRWLMTIESSYGGIDMVTRLWRESRPAEHPLMTLRRLKGWSQSALNDFIYDYATRDVAFDYPTRGFGAAMRRQREIYRTDRGVNHFLWREHTVLERVDSASGHYRVDDDAAPQEYGFNVIPLHPTCASRAVQVRFRGHDESDSDAGWRWGFVAVAADGVSARYGGVARSSDSSATFTMTPGETELYLVIVGASSTHTSYEWEPGWPRIRRFPYEVRIENALPEGYQAGYRDELRRLFPLARHVNGGGWVSADAIVAATVYVGPNAVVLGASRLGGNVRVEGRARLERVTAEGNVGFDGDATVVGGTYRDSTVVTDRALLYDCTVSGGARIGGNAFSWGSTFVGALTIGGDAELGTCTTPGVYLQVPHPNNGREHCDGRGADHPSNIDINTPVVPFANLALDPIGCDGVTGVDAEAAQSAVSVTVAPNPARSTLSIRADGFDPAASLSLRIVDMRGVVVLTDELGLRRTASYPTAVIGSAASYVVTVESGGRTAARCVVIEE